MSEDARAKGSAVRGGGGNLREILSTWDARNGKEGSMLAPLSQLQLDSITDVALAVEDRPLPDLPDGDDIGATGVVSIGEAQDIDGVDGLEPVMIDRTSDFLTWFAKLEAHREKEEEATLHAHADIIKEYNARCEEILQEIQKAVGFLNELRAEYTSVATKTSALHDDCEELLREQTSLVNFAESLQSRLAYFTELDRLNKKFSSPTLSVLSSEFVPLLSRLDECIEYMETHATFHDASTYLQKFRQLQARGLNLVKLHVINTLKMASQNVLTQTQGSEENPESFTLFYGKFRLHAPRIKSLMDELEKRQYATHTHTHIHAHTQGGASGESAPVVNQEYAVLLAECYNCYFSQRSALLSSSIKKKIEQLKAEHKEDLAGLVRAGCVYMMHMCSKECELYRHFFSTLHPGLTVMLEDLTAMLAEACRPLYLSHTHIDTLVSLITVLKVEVLEDKGVETLAFASVAADMLQDVQIRLAYRAEQYVSAEIERFVPSRMDLAYPDKLGQLEQREDSLYSTWYPTLSRALLLLSKLYRCLDRKVFEGLSQEVVYACVRSLCEGSRALCRERGSVHSHLFLIKHLLILREQIAPFDIELSTAEIGLDFKNLKDAASSLMAHTSSIFRMDKDNALLSFLVQGAPELTQRHLDARKEVDEQLRNVCQEYIRDMVKALSGSLQSFVTIVDALPAASRQALSKQSFATPEKVRELVRENERKVNEELVSITKLLHVYLNNKETELILFRPIKNDVMQVFQSFRNVVCQSYVAEDLAIIGCPSFAEMDLMLRLRATPQAATSTAPSAASSSLASQRATPSVSVRASVSSPTPEEQALAPTALSSPSSAVSAESSTVPPAVKSSPAPAHTAESATAVSPASLEAPGAAESER